MPDEVVIEGDETPADDGDTIVTVVTTPAADAAPSDDLALAVGQMQGVLASIVDRLDRIESTAETAAVVAETAAVIAAEAVEEAAEEEPVEVVEEVEPDEEPVKEPWTHRRFGIGSKD